MPSRELWPHRQAAAATRTRVLRMALSGCLLTSSINNADRYGNSSKSASRGHAIHERERLTRPLKHPHHEIVDRSRIFTLIASITQAASRPTTA